MTCNARATYLVPKVKMEQENRRKLEQKMKANVSLRYNQSVMQEVSIFCTPVLYFSYFTYFFAMSFWPLFFVPFVLFSLLESRGLPWQRHALPWLPCRPKRRIAPSVHTNAKQKKMPHDQDYKLARFAKYGPPPLTSEEKTKQEKGFILDAIAVSTLSDDSGRANPKMATAIPPYNGQKDKHAKGYFEKPVVQKLLNKTEQVI